MSTRKKHGAYAHLTSFHATRVCASKRNMMTAVPPATHRKGVSVSPCRIDVIHLQSQQVRLRGVGGLPPQEVGHKVNASQTWRSGEPTPFRVSRTIGLLVTAWSLGGLRGGANSVQPGRTFLGAVMPPLPCQLILLYLPGHPSASFTSATRSWRMDQPRSDGPLPNLISALRWQLRSW